MTHTRQRQPHVFGFASLGVVLLLAGCPGTLVGGSEPATDRPAKTSAGAAKKPLVFGGSRPVELHVPPRLESGRALPLIIALHGYGYTGGPDRLLRVLGLDRLAARGEAMLLAPRGTLDRTGRLFWNATGACCDFFDSGVDDVGYLSRLITEVGRSHPVDRRRVYLVGISNGGFMAHRMACERSNLVTAVVSIAGAMVAHPSRCKLTAPVSVAQVHGDHDGIVRFSGGIVTLKDIPPQQRLGGYPPAATTVGSWARLDGCRASLDPIARNVDLDAATPGAESEVFRAGGCPAGIDVELWTVHGGRHVPNPTAALRDRIRSFLFKHPRP